MFGNLTRVGSMPEGWNISWVNFCGVNRTQVKEGQVENKAIIWARMGSTPWGK